MFRILLLIFVLLPTFSIAADIEKNVKDAFMENLRSRGIENVDIEVEVLEKIKELKGYYAAKLIIHDENKKKDISQYIITNGYKLIPDLIDIKSSSSLIKKLTLLHESTNIDTSKLSLLYGDKNAKNIIVEVGDFQCPYCKKAYNYIHDKIKGKGNISVYQLHKPLKMHKKAELYAKILEAGLAFNVNFADELYNGNFRNYDDNETIDYFASKTTNPGQFKEKVYSEEIQNLINYQTDYAKKLGINATPIIYLNGKKVRGFNEELINNAIELFE